MRSRRVSAMTSNVSGTPLPVGLRPRRVAFTPATPPPSVPSISYFRPAQTGKPAPHYPRPTTHQKGIRRDALECAREAMLTSRTRR
jgi:hypothetical protein